MTESVANMLILLTLMERVTSLRTIISVCWLVGYSVGWYVVGLSQFPNQLKKTSLLPGLSVCHKFLKGREVQLPCSYRSTCFHSYVWYSYAIYTSANLRLVAFFHQRGLLFFIYINIFLLSNRWIDKIINVRANHNSLSIFIPLSLSQLSLSLSLSFSLYLSIYLSIYNTHSLSQTILNRKLTWPKFLCLFVWQNSLSAYYLA